MKGFNIFLGIILVISLKYKLENKTKNLYFDGKLKKHTWHTLCLNNFTLVKKLSTLVIIIIVFIQISISYS